MISRGYHHMQACIAWIRIVNDLAFIPIPRRGLESRTNTRIHPCRRVAASRFPHGLALYRGRVVQCSAHLERSRSRSCRCCHMAARRVLRAWRAFRGGTCVVGYSRWLSLGVRVSGRVRKRGGGSARFGRLRKSSPTSRVGASTWVGIGSRGAGWLGAAGL